MSLPALNGLGEQQGQLPDERRAKDCRCEDIEARTSALSHKGREHSRVSQPSSPKQFDRRCNGYGVSPSL
jgi:hypothetical protein